MRSGLIAGAGGAGRRPGQQMVGAERARPAGPAADRAAAGAEPDHGVEPRRDVRAAERLRRLGARHPGRPSPWRSSSRWGSGCGARRAGDGGGDRRHRRRGDRQRDRPASASARWSTSSTPISTRRGAIFRGTSSTSPMRPSFAGSRRWSWSHWCRSIRGKGSARRPDRGRFGFVVAPPIATVKTELVWVAAAVWTRFSGYLKSHEARWPGSIRPATDRSSFAGRDATQSHLRHRNTANGIIVVKMIRPQPQA